MAYPPIVTLTINPSVDTSTGVDQVTPDQKLRCAAPVHEPGGGGINVSRVIRELGGDTLALWTRGGFTGELLQSLLDDLALPHRPLPIADSNRENFVVSEAGSGRQFRFVMPGPRFSPAEVDACIARVEAAAPVGGCLVLSGSLAPGLPVDFYGRIVARCGARRCRVVIDTSGPALAASLGSGVFLIKPNLRELAELSGRELDDDATIEAAARQLVEAGRSQVVLSSLGAGGALLVTREGALRLHAPTVPIRSRVGAGDSMVAGVTLALARGEDVQQAARLGIAAGSAAVMTPGTQLCRRADVERLYTGMAR